jgi:hypothetical protein
MVGRHRATRFGAPAIKLGGLSFRRDGWRSGTGSGKETISGPVSAPLSAGRFGYLPLCSAGRLGVARREFGRGKALV